MGETGSLFTISKGAFMLLILLIVLLAVVAGGGGYYMGPGVGYYGGGGLSIILGLIAVYLLYGRGRTRI